MSNADESEAKLRAEWLHKHKAHKNWIILSVSEIAVIKDELLLLERERDEALMDRANGDIATMTINHYERILRERDEVKEKYRWAVIHWQIGAAKMERERDEAREAFKIVYNERVQMELERNEWKNKAYSHATDYTLMEAKCFRLEQELKEIHSNQSVIIKHYDKLKS